MRVLRLLHVVVFGPLLAQVVLFAGQTPSPRPQVLTTGAVTGQVVDARTNLPVTGAWVGLRTPAGAPVLTTFITGTDGAFSFSAVPMGRYVVYAQKEGFANGSSGQRRIDGPSRPIEVTADSPLVSISIPIWKYGTISGRIVDEAGEPVVNVQPMAVRLDTTGGTRAWSLAGVGMTDDRGVFRIVYLRPGTYTVVVPSTTSTTPIAISDAAARLAANPGSSATNASPDLLAPIALRDQRSAAIRIGEADVTVYREGVLLQPPNAFVAPYFAYAATFAPGVTTPDAASVVMIDAGEDRDNVDVRLEPVRTVHVSGRVVDGEGRPLPVAALELRPAYLPPPGYQSASIISAVTVSDRDGGFTLAGVPPGRYVLRSADPTGLVGATGTRGYGEAIVTVGATDLGDVTLTVQPTSISGQVVFDGKTARPDLSLAARFLVWLTTAQIQPVAGARPDKDGHFVIAAHPPGKYWVASSSPGAGWTLAGATIGGRDVFDEPFEVAAAPISDLTLRFTDAVTTIAGTVRGSAADVDGALVTAFPVNYTERRETGVNPRLRVTATAAKDGTFELRMPRGGQYILAALPADAPESVSFDAMALTGLRVSIAEGERQSASPLLMSIR